MCADARQAVRPCKDAPLLRSPHIAGLQAMKRDDELRVRPGRIRFRSRGQARPFVARALAAAEKAGGLARKGRISKRGSTFGRGRAASLAASRGLAVRGRICTVKARVVRHRMRSTSLAAHLTYLRRDGVTRDGGPGRLFDAGHDDADHRAFAERCEGDRHHFRFIVSPEDAPAMTDLKAFTRDLMANAARDLGTALDWVAVEHHNTEHPHVHVLVRGRADDGADLVISRDYIREGLRGRAQALVTQELGPRTDQEIRRELHAQVEAERWTPLDRMITHEAGRHDGVVDLRPERMARPDELRAIKVGRMGKLERLGLAASLGPARWRLDLGAEATLHELGERGDIIKRLHRTMGERNASELVLAAEEGSNPVIGRLVARGLDDELKGSAYAVVDGLDGRAHHLRLPDLDATSDAAPGAIVELRRFEDAGGRQRVALAVRSDLAVDLQVRAPGATWLDRRLIERAPVQLSEGGFGGEVRRALEARTEHLVSQGLAHRQRQLVVFARDLLDTLRQRELAAVGTRLASETGLSARLITEGDHVAGVYRQRVSLASGRFAMIDDGLGFSLVPWTPGLERHLGRQVSGVAAPSGIDWSFRRKRGLGIG